MRSVLARRLNLLSRRCLSTLQVVEPHHHFVVTGEAFHGPLKAAGLGAYLPEHFDAEVKGCAEAGIEMTKAVHMECMATDPLAEATYVEGVIAEADPYCAVVAACDLSAPDAVDRLTELKEKCANVVGIRYVVDYAGPFGEAPKTHFFVSRHGADGAVADLNGGAPGADFLRDPALAPQFEAGLAALSGMGLTFDLQCAPEQLDAAAAMIGRNPDVKVVLDHLGKPRLGEGDDAAELAAWRAGMEEMAALPNVYVKLSMLGYVVPGWVADADKEAEAAELVRETINLFKPARCMFSTNWWGGGSFANSDGRDDVDISMAELWGRYHGWVRDHYTEAEVARMMAGTAEEFYGI